MMGARRKRGIAVAVAIAVFVLTVAGVVSGFVLFRPKTLPEPAPAARLGKRKWSVIIPARNEEDRLPTLLKSLGSQTFSPHEVIVVDDASEDRTREIAERFGAKVVDNPPLPEGWTGKCWAAWNGYLASTGDVLVFLDADVELAPDALERLAAALEAGGGVVSAVPYHVTAKWHERPALLFNLLGMFAFVSPFEENSPRKGLYGSCIATSRGDYEKVGGHAAVRSEVLEDVALGARYAASGIPVRRFLGWRHVRFRMYPRSLGQAIEGFGKGAALGPSFLSGATLGLSAVWTAGLVVAETAVWWWDRPVGWAAAAGYALYTAQIAYFSKYAGRFGVFVPLVHAVSSLFFLGVMVYSLCQVGLFGRVRWKGRYVRVGGERRG